jgi:hypothetical protein
MRTVVHAEESRIDPKDLPSATVAASIANQGERKMLCRNA